MRMGTYKQYKYVFEVSPYSGFEPSASVNTPLLLKLVSLVPTKLSITCSILKSGESLVLNLLISSVYHISLFLSNYMSNAWYMGQQSLASLMSGMLLHSSCMLF